MSPVETKAEQDIRKIMELTKLNMIIIAMTGMMMAVFGFLLLFAVDRSFLEENMRFFLPIPPLGVAAYVYAFNFCKKAMAMGDISGSMMLKDTFVSIAYASVIFLGFIAPMMVFVYFKALR